MDYPRQVRWYERRDETQYPDHYASVGDTVVFEHEELEGTLYPKLTNVYRMQNKKAFDNCNPDNGVNLTPVPPETCQGYDNSTNGPFPFSLVNSNGGSSTASNFRWSGKNCVTKYTITEADAAYGVVYFASFPTAAGTFYTFR